MFQHGINRASTSLSILRGTSRYWGGVELVKKKAPSPWSDHIETTLPSKVCQGSISTTASNVTKFIYESMFHKRNQENKRGDIEPEYLPRLLEYDCSGRRFSGHVRIGRRCRFVDGEPEQAGAHRSQQVQPSSPESTESTSREYIRYVIKIFCMIRSKVFIPPPDSSDPARSLRTPHHQEERGLMRPRSAKFSLCLGLAFEARWECLTESERKVRHTCGYGFFTT